MIRRTAVRPRLFPSLVATGSLVLALVLFVWSTVPALKERQELQRLETNGLEAKQQLMQEATSFALRRTALSRDIQTVLMELDRQGIYPEALLDELREQGQLGQLGQPDRKPDGPQ